MGIRLLPPDFETAVSYLLAGEGGELRGMLGEDLVQCVVATRRSEWKALQGMDVEKEVELLYGRY